MAPLFGELEEIVRRGSIGFEGLSVPARIEGHGHLRWRPFRRFLLGGVWLLNPKP